MQISFDNFKQIVTSDALHKAGVHAIPRAHQIMKTQYCDKLTLRGACSGKCNTCALKIKSAVDWIIGTKPEKPYGLYTWLCKNAGGQKVEEVAHSRQTMPETNVLGETTGRDGLDILLETLS